MFYNAKPIWIKDKTHEMNVQAVFSVKCCTKEHVEIHIAGTAFYRLYADDVFLAAGPARTAKDYVREDIISLPKGTKTVVIEAVGYYCKSIATVIQPSYLIAEIQTLNHQVVAYTGRDFNAYYPKTKLQKVERYSVQRHFTEIWDYRNVTSLTDDKTKTDWEVVNVNPTVLDRKAPYPIYENIFVDTAKFSGKFEFDEELPYKKQRYSWATVPKDWGRFDDDEIEHRPHTWIQRQKQTILEQNVSLPKELSQGEFAIFDMQKIEAGFITLDYDSLKASDIVIGYTEYYEGDEFRFQNMNVHNVIECFTNKGTYSFQSFEPYTCRYAILLVKEGHINLKSFGVKSYMLDTKNAKKIETDDTILQSVYQAALRNYAHNEVDLYMDCPSRERAGWAGDAYFTAKGEYAITGNTFTEDAFLENYLLYKNNGELPEGALPECYPSDIPPMGDFIPQFTMLFILEVYEYVTERGHAELTDTYKERIYELLQFYEKYENEDGLLEQLPSWNFVEWGPANDWIQDVSYPTNFLYSKVLECVHKLYQDEKCAHKCNHIRKICIEHSFNGTYFLDHSVRNSENKLVLQPEVSEVGQYYAVLFGNIPIDDAKYSKLKDLILNVFSPDRRGRAPEILEFNMIMGAYMRMELLLKMHEYELLLHDIKLMFGQMEEKTGTLWEYRIQKGSYDHGLCAYVAHATQTALKGLEENE